MAEPGGAGPTGGGLAAAPSPPPPPPPPPPPQQPPPQTETTGTDMAERRGAGAPTEEQTTGLPPPGQPPVHTEAPGAGAQPPRAPSQESAVAAEEENQLPPPPPSQQEQQQDDSAKDGEGSATTKPRPARWPRIRPPVMWLLSLFRLRSQRQPIEQPKILPPPPGEGAGGGRVPDKAATEKDEGEGSKRRPRWGKVEARLEKILEEACMRLVAGDYMNLKDDKKQRCLLTFSVFPPGKDVKKQAVTYWWATQFGLSTAKRAGADGVFTQLSGGGFLEPIKNRCSGVIHGCRVNPLVHWMVKHQARVQEAIADLEERGNPADKQPKSALLCVTAGNRDRLQSLRELGEWRSQARPKPAGTKKTSKEPSQVEEVAGPSQDLEDQIANQLTELEMKKAIVNINANVYRLPELMLSKFTDRLEVLQLGRWWNSDDETYMEVEALEYITKLKNLRYLSLRGLFQLTKLPNEFRKLRRLTILDLRGCHNLVKVSSSAVTNLTGLTHLDLTECYMLEYIGRGIIALSELQVFKGFVFGVGVQRHKACQLSDLVKLRKLRKLSINITTETTVNKEEMAQLGELASLRLLTVKWGALPSIFWAGGGDKDERMTRILDGWTGLVLPPMLEKLDVQCYPRDTLPRKWFQGHEHLQKLYVRGGDVEKLEIPSGNNIETLRLRYLDKFNMSWEELFAMLNKDIIKFVEVVDKDPKVMMNQMNGEGGKVKDDQTKKRVVRLKTRMKVPGSTLDEKGVWIFDEKEEYIKAPGVMVRKDDGAAGGAQAEVKGGGGNREITKAEDGPPNKQDGGDTAQDNKNC